LKRGRELLVRLPRGMVPTTSEREIERQKNERRECNRVAQARYREYRAATLVEARVTVALLARRKWHAADTGRLADILNSLARPA
jgi:hypothetical protein